MTTTKKKTRDQLLTEKKDLTAEYHNALDECYTVKDKKGSPEQQKLHEISMKLRDVKKALKEVTV